MPVNAYEVRGLTKVYAGRKQPANIDVSLDIRSAELFCLLGNNGSGKSTLIRQLACLVKPSAGRIFFFGKDAVRHAQEVHERAGYMPQTGFSLGHLTVSEAVYFSGRLRGLTRRDARRDRDEIVERFGMGRVVKDVSQRLSGGQRRLVQFALCIAGRPDVVILDEPTNDLDAGRRRLIWDVCADLKHDTGSTIVLVTHDVAEAERVIDRVAIMREGRVAGVGTPAELRRNVEERLCVRVMAEARPASTWEWSEPERGSWLTYVHPCELPDFMASLTPEQLGNVRVEPVGLRYLVNKWQAADQGRVLGGVVS
ncbi:ABC transporter ATP-binding protein [Streptomyces luomodiensis]|uniref:ABC transporter ATP-binding protein n=1 Tax=Streptomyces luomodiensis TaxID=3026192 RepID=A0ABY9USP7_9ACTN|nr:ABC transporter ATP-binding protein [Streptomyces sp. SCA4-21]WNE95506.1 ABC transporter ATP-binding protein [Streptomyces sp. SCA4-21]